MAGLFTQASARSRGGKMAANEKTPPRSKHVSRLSEASQFFMAEDAETLNAVEDWPAVDSDSTSERVRYKVHF